MRDLIYYVAVTVDGFIADPDGNFDFFPAEGDHLGALLAELRETCPVHLREPLARLRPRTREALILRYYADLSVAEVARLMRCPESTVKTLTRRGLMKLRAQPEFAAAREGHNG